MSHRSLPFIVCAAIAASAPTFAQTVPAAPAPTAAPAPAAPVSIVAGAMVKGPAGAPVGTVASVADDYVVVRTDRHDVNLPKAAFAASPEGLVIGLSRDELNASVDQAMAKLAQMLQPGGVVFGVQGARLGTIEAVESDLVTVKLVSGKMVRLPKAGFAPGPEGAMIGLTAAQLEAQAG